jgi:hypothetical protein
MATNTQNVSHQRESTAAKIHLTPAPYLRFTTVLCHYSVTASRLHRRWDVPGGGDSAPIVDIDVSSYRA